MWERGHSGHSGFWPISHLVVEWESSKSDEQIDGEAIKFSIDARELKMGCVSTAQLHNIYPQSEHCMEHLLPSPSALPFVPQTSHATVSDNDSFLGCEIVCFHASRELLSPSPALSLVPQTSHVTISDIDSFLGCKIVCFLLFVCAWV
jgi:hypothetical protein